MTREAEPGSRGRGASAHRAPVWRIRAIYGLGTMICGLALRRYGLGLGLPFPLVKYGGSLLWGTMVFFLVALLPATRSRRRTAEIAAVIVIGVELFRLFHTPWLDAFRLTPAGALLLGRVFSPWNVLAYGCGIICAAGVDHFAARIAPQQPPHSPS